MLPLSKVGLALLVAGCVDVPGDPFEDQQIDEDLECVGEPCAFPPSAETWQPETEISITEMLIINSTLTSYATVLGNQPSTPNRTGFFFGVGLELDDTPQLRFVATPVRPTAMHYDAAFRRLVLAGKNTRADDDGTYFMHCGIDVELLGGEPGAEVECSDPVAVGDARGDDVRVVVSGELTETAKNPDGEPDVVLSWGFGDPVYWRPCYVDGCLEPGPLKVGPPSSSTNLASNVKAMAVVPTVLPLGDRSPEGLADLIILQRPENADEWRRISFLTTPEEEDPHFQDLATISTGGDSQRGFALVDLEETTEPDVLTFGGTNDPEPPRAALTEVSTQSTGFQALAWTTEQVGPPPGTAVAMAGRSGASGHDVAFLTASEVAVLVPDLRSESGVLVAGDQALSSETLGDEPVDLGLTRTTVLVVNRDGYIVCFDITPTALEANPACSSME